MFIPDPGSWFLPIPDPGSRIPDSKTATTERGEKKIFVLTFYAATNFSKLQIILVLECWRKKIWANFQRIIELFTQKIVTKLSKKWVWDPGSGKHLFRIPDPGVKKASNPGSRIRIRNTAEKTLNSTVLWLLYDFLPVFRIRLRRISTFLGLPDPHPHPLDGGTDPRFRINTYQDVTDTQHCLPTIIWYL